MRIPALGPLERLYGPARPRLRYHRPGRHLLDAAGPSAIIAAARLPRPFHGDRTMTTTRRQLLHAGLAAGAGLAFAAGAPAIEPVRRGGRPHLRLSLAAYSFRKYLDLKIKPKPPMTLEDF